MPILVNRMTEGILWDPNQIQDSLTLEIQPES